MADLEAALKRWAADREAAEHGAFTSSTIITEVKLHFTEGWEGTDVTPGDPASFRVSYVVTRNVVVKMDGKDLTKFIKELVERA